MPKLYFYDVGLVSWLLGIRTAEQVITHPLRGNIFETFIISELIKSNLNKGEKPAISFWRDSNGNEVDLVIEQGGQLTPVEIKSGRTLTPEAFTGLQKWCGLAGKKVGIKIFSKFPMIETFMHFSISRSKFIPVLRAMASKGILFREALLAGLQKK